jgi:hypothetical protein
MASQLRGGPGRPGATLPIIPTMPSMMATTAIKVSIGQKYSLYLGKQNTYHICLLKKFIQEGAAPSCRK